MPGTNPVQKMIEVSPTMEIWWDSSPLIYEEWLAGPGQDCRATELFTIEPGQATFEGQSLLRGATTNQPLTWQVIEQYPDLWHKWLAAQAEGLPAKEAMWRLFIEVAARGADRLASIFEASEYRQGQICCQVDPRDMSNVAAMVDQARRIHAARSNIMVKMPGTQEGIEGVRILTAEGIPTNVTLGFTVAQLVAVGEAAQAGLAEARQRGVNLCYWRSCAVMMLGRYEDAPPLQAQAKERGITLSEADTRWAGIAIFRQAHRLFKERNYPTKLMAASMRLGPTVEGVRQVWHIEKLAGADAVLTIFPNIFETFIPTYANRPIEPQIDDSVPDEVMERLMQLPYFEEAYDEHGLAPADFVNHPALQLTAASFADSMAKVEMFAAHNLN